MLNKIKPLIRQYAVVITINLSTFCAGMGGGWVSPVLVKLTNGTDTILPRPITLEEGSWLIATNYPASIPTSLLAAYILDRIGRKYSLLVGSFPKIIASLIYMFGCEVWMLLVARVMWGLSDGLVMCTVPAYASEIASKEIRGALGTILYLALSLGTVTMYSIGPYISYFKLNATLGCIVIVNFLPLLAVPDSPYFLNSRDRKEESKQILTKLRGSEYSAIEEMKQYDLAIQETEVSKIELFKNRLFLKSLIISVVFNALGILAGQQVVLGYLETILISTGTSISPQLATIVIGFLQFSAGLFTILVTDKFGRKYLLAVTFVLTAVGWVGLGTFFKLQELDYEIKGVIEFIPIISLVLIVTSNGAGFASSSHTVSAELFDGPARATGVSLTGVANCVSMFLVTKSFAVLVASIGPMLTYWLFGANCVLACLFVVYCLPETKGKTFAEIQGALRSKTKVPHEDCIKYNSKL